MKRRILVLLLIAVMCVTAIGCTQTTAAPTATAAPEQTQPVAGGQTVSSPMNPVASLQELLAAQPSVKLNDAPAGATNTAYCWITNIPAISQITFTLDGCDYTYRAAASASEAAALDISGVYEQFPSINTIDLAKTNALGGSYLLKYDGTTGAGLASWYLPLTKCQYTLYTTNGCGGTMPLMKVMDALYNYTAGAMTAKGAVLDVNSSNIILNVENSGTCVLELTSVKLQDIAVGDEVEFGYIGDLAGSAMLVSIKKLGSSQYQEVKGYVGDYSATDVYVITADKNVFVFTIDGSTIISGVAKSLSLSCDVIVSYSGDLSTKPVAKSIEITKAAPAPTPTPRPTAAPYVVRSASGYVTSAAGVYVTVAGEMFTVNSGDCYVEGVAYEGAYAYIVYNDYGGGYHVVTEAYFSDPTPTPAPYVERTMAGYVDNVGGTYVSVNGVGFTVNSANCTVDGTATVGCYAEIDYRDYGGGYYEVTYAFFEIGDVPIVYSWDDDYDETSGDWGDYYYGTSGDYDETGGDYGDYYAGAVG